MIVTPRMVLRIALLLVATVVLQVAFFSQLSIFGATPNVLPVVVVALGLMGGGVVGAVCGFATGLVVDSVLLQTLGISSLVLLTVGYLAGRYREGFEISSSLTPPLLTGALTMFAAVAFAAIQLMLGIEAPVSLLILREIILQSVFGMLLALPVYPAVRRLVRPALVEDAPRRRPGYTSPLRAG